MPIATARIAAKKIAFAGRVDKKMLAGMDDRRWLSIGFLASLERGALSKLQSWSQSHYHQRSSSAKQNALITRWCWVNLAQSTMDELVDELVAGGKQ